MAKLTKTLGGINPFSLPSDGGLCSVKPKTHKNEKNTVHRAIRREGKRIILETIVGNDGPTLDWE